jgi:hypothetical protein
MVTLRSIISGLFGEDVEISEHGTNRYSRVDMSTLNAKELGGGNSKAYRIAVLKPGNPHDLNSDMSELNINEATGGGTSKAYRIAVLKREAPDLAA